MAHGSLHQWQTKGLLCLAFAKVSWATRKYAIELACQCISPAVGVQVIITRGEKRGNGCEACNTSAMNTGHGIDCSVIIPDHKSCSASQCSLRSFSPRCPVGAIFSLRVQRGSTAVVATWIWGLCHSCRLEQHWSCKLYSFLFPLLGLQNNSCSEGNEQRQTEKRGKTNRL